MRDEKKRRGLYSYLRNQKCDIILLQETHCKLKKEEYRWGKEWEGQTVWSRGTSNSKGVSVMFSSGTKYDIIKTVVDPNGISHVKSNLVKLCTTLLISMLQIMNMKELNFLMKCMKCCNLMETMTM